MELYMYTGLVFVLIMCILVENGMLHKVTVHAKYIFKPANL